jgi:hypothetical protein
MILLIVLAIVSMYTLIGLVTARFLIQHDVFDGDDGLAAIASVAWPLTLVVGVFYLFWYLVEGHVHRFVYGKDK